MKNFIQDGKSITVAAPAATTAGDFVAIDELRGVAVADAESGAPVTIQTEGVFALPSAGLTVGAAVEWDGSAVVALNTGDKIGVVIANGTGVDWVKISC